MTLPVRHRDILIDYYNNPSHPIWARDLVGMVILKNGDLDSCDIEKVLDEILTPPPSMSVILAGCSDSPYPKIEINKITHINGVKALASNQTIDFCNEGHTYLFGHNGSGKSSYFHILNQLAGGGCSYPIDGNIYIATPAPISVLVEYFADGVPFTFSWNGIAEPPSELSHIRLFDSQYAELYLSSRGCNEYIFKSYNLQRFTGLANAICELKEMGAQLGAENIYLDALYNNAYCNTFIRAFQNEFQNELNLLGMDYLRVTLSINDLLKTTAEIKVCINN